MGNMFITSKNKKPMINFERNQLKNQNPKNLLVRKLHLKCMKNVNKMKKKG